VAAGDTYPKSKGGSNASSAAPLRAIPAKPDDPFVWGSVTKLLTGVDVLHHVERGALRVTDLAHPLVDPFFRAWHAADPATWNFSSMADLWGPAANEITVAHLASMTAGVPDYDSSGGKVDLFRAQCYADPGREWGAPALFTEPWEATALLFPPGSQKAYSSSNFVLLGLALARLRNGSTTQWDSYEQAAVLRLAEAASTVGYKYRSVAFGAHGTPWSHGAVYGFDRSSANGNNPRSVPGFDVTSVAGVFGGWTASDMVATVADVAELTHEIFGPAKRLLSQASVDLMTTFPVPQPGAPEPLSYGFAAFDLAARTGQEFSPWGVAVGHMGATYGYQSVAIYSLPMNFSIAVASNIETDMQVQPNEALCLVFNAVKNMLLGEEDASCSDAGGSYYKGACACNDTVPATAFLCSSDPAGGGGCYGVQNGTAGATDKATCEQGCQAPTPPPSPKPVPTPKPTYPNFCHFRSDCNYHGNCVNSAACVCDDGFTGPRCENATATAAAVEQAPSS